MKLGVQIAVLSALILVLAFSTISYMRSSGFFLKMTGMAPGDDCDDSDNGENIAIKGDCLSIYGGSGSDFCVDSTHLKEFYCPSSQSLCENKTISCPSGQICQGGKCIEEPHCIDTDNGKDYTIKGACCENALSCDFEIATKEDDCVNETHVKEFYCAMGFCKFEASVYCGANKECVNGKCQIKSSSCGDGIVNGTESCDGANLTGKTCANFNFNNGTLSCYSNCAFNLTGCFNSTSSPPITCFDSDGGMNYSVKGNCTNSTSSYLDSCDTNGNLTEYFCTGNICNSTQYSCSGNYTCNQSRCILGNSTSLGFCGDRFADINEECDGDDLAGETCMSQGYLSGNLSCNSNCTLNFSECSGYAPPSSNDLNSGDSNLDKSNLDKSNLDKSNLDATGSYGKTRSFGFLIFQIVFFGILAIVAFFIIKMIINKRKKKKQSSQQPAPISFPTQQPPSYPPSQLPPQLQQIQQQYPQQPSQPQVQQQINPQRKTQSAEELRQRYPFLNK